MFSNPNTNRHLYLFLALLSMIGIFWLDMYLPLGIATATLYIIPVLLSWNAKQLMTPIAIGVFCSVLTILGFFFSDDPDPQSTAPEINRVLSFSVILISSLVVFVAKNNFNKFIIARNELKRFNIKLHAKNEEIEQFAYIASHDLQEPVRTVMSMTELLRKDYKDKLDDKSEQMFDFIIQASSRMSSLIKGLLDYSRLGKKSNLMTIDATDTMNQVIKDLQLKIRDHNANVSIEQLPKLRAYPTELYQLFQNLVSNALKYSKEDVHPEIRVSAITSDTHSQFCIEDNGIGIEKEYYEKIFVIFQRLHARDSYAGIGIGLANCRKIVELHEGKIWVESEIGSGSKFYFTVSNNL